MKRSTVGLWVVLAALVCGCSQSAPDADGGLDAAVDAPRADGPPADGPAPGDVGPPSDARDAG
ncbi:MAG: hypothetical protein KC503_44945, partial [Myxococcales bacterium]|nr:hypothetical protein [Myxococcales bacterium]